MSRNVASELPLKGSKMKSGAEKGKSGKPSGQAAEAKPTVLPFPSSKEERARNTTQIPQVSAPPAPLMQWKIPLIGNWPLDRQIKMLTYFVIGALFICALFVYRDFRQSSHEAGYAELIGDSLMHSQRLAKAVPNAVQGKPAAFTQLRDSRDTLTANLKTLTEGGGEHGLPAASGSDQKVLVTLTNEWKRSEKNASVVLENEKALTTIGAALQRLNQDNSALLDVTQQIAALKLQSGASPREISASTQLTMLTQRMIKNANELISSEGGNLEEIASILGKDLNTFRILLDGLYNGNASLGLAASKDGPVGGRLAQLQKRFDPYEEDINVLLDSLRKIIATKQAEQEVFRDNENLRTSILSLQNRYGEQSKLRYINLAMMIVCGFLALAGGFLIGKAYFDNTAALATEAERRRIRAQQQEEEARQTNNANQAAILRLMNELQEVADGNLTMQATVSEDITGAIADSVNYTVEELRTLVGRINNTAEQVTKASTEAQKTSERLLIASEQQSHEIRSTGESVLKMTAQINEVSSSAMESANVARQSLAAAEDGQRAVENSIAGMNEIREQIQETSKRIKRLGESSQEIGEIIELISDITEQTNVLALNAAIQAASAGEAGRGFSVVAEEVQRLAERSAEATKQIGALVRTIQTDTQDAVVAMEKSTQGVVEGAKLSDAAGQALANIGRVSRTLAELIEQISANTSAQAQSAGGVAKSIEYILEVNEETSTGTRQTASSIQQLSQLAQELKSSVTRFKVA